MIQDVEKLLDAKDAEILSLRAKLAEAREKERRPQWFYFGDDCSSDQCRFGVHEIIDEDFLCDHDGVGEHVVKISTAGPCATIWAHVKFFTEKEKDARQSDDDYEITEYATEAEARARLALDEGGSDE